MQADEAKTILGHRLEKVPVSWQTVPIGQALRREAARQSARSVGALSPPSVLAQKRFQGPDSWTKVEWVSYNWEPEGHRQTLPLRGAGVATFARRLMAVEKKRMRSRTPLKTRGLA